MIMLYYIFNVNVNLKFYVLFFKKIYFEFLEVVCNEMDVLYNIKIYICYFGFDYLCLYMYLKYYY